MQLTKHILFVPALAATLLFTGCHTTTAHGPLGSRIDASLLQYASTADRARVSEANRAHDAANEELLTAQRALTEAEGRLEVADKSLEVAKAELDRARTAAKVDADGSGDAAVREQIQGVRDAEAEVLAAKLDIDVADHGVAVARQKCDLALAKVDLEAAKAVVATERTDVRRIEVPDFERAVRAEEADLKVSEVRLEQATRDAKAGKATREERNKGLAEGDGKR